MSNASAGPTIAFICAVFILGTNIPWLELKSSSIEEAFGVLVPIPTLFWEKPTLQKMYTARRHINFLPFDKVYLFMVELGDL
jgi:hypothetical protein